MKLLSTLVLLAATTSVSASTISNAEMEALTGIYQLEFDGEVQEQFGQGSLFDISFLQNIKDALDDDSDGDSIPNERKRPGRVKYSNIVLKSLSFNELLDHHSEIENMFADNIPNHNEEEWEELIEKLQGDDDCNDDSDSSEEHHSCGGYTAVLTPVNTSPVPLPAAVWLFGAGLIGLAGFARRK